MRESPKRWVVTGAAGFIGSNLLRELLSLGQSVVGLDNFSNGSRQNLEVVSAVVGDEAWKRFQFVEADITNPDACHDIVRGADYILHQAALGSVPRSLANPQGTNAANINGFLNMLVAARDAGVSRFVYAASSSTYGDHPGLPKVEDRIGRPLSPYAVTKYVNELYAEVFGRSYGTPSIGLRYFNVFGPHQSPAGPYAAVIPTWVRAMLAGEPVFINGDGSTSRDFCYVANAVQANLLAATATDPAAVNQVYNVAVGHQTSLGGLFNLLRDELQRRNPGFAIADPVFRDFRAGDVRHSRADISKASSLLGYCPTHTVADGVREAMAWYLRTHAPQS